MAVDLSDDKRKIRLHIEMKQSRDEACLRVTRLPKASVSNRDQKLNGIGSLEEEFGKNPCESASKSCFETIIQQDGNCPLTVGMKYMPDTHKALIPQVEFDVRKSEDECKTSRDGQKRVQDNNGRSAASKTEAIEEKRSVLALRRMMDDGKVDAGFQDGKQAPSAGLDHYANNSDRAPAVSTSPRMPPSSPQLKYRSPPNCTETCSGVNKPSPPTAVLDPEATLLRRNGLDDDNSRKFRKSFGKPSRVCPVRCCTPPRAPRASKSPAQSLSALCANCPQSRVPRKSKSQSSSILRKSNEEPAASETRSRNSGRSSFREQPSKSVRDCAETRKISLPDCEELATRYRDYFTEVQLEKYQERSSKRNGLQDEYRLPVPRAVLELRREELRQEEVANVCH